MKDNSISKINSAVVQYFADNSSAESAKPKDLMSLLVDSELFKKDIRNGKPLRDILRELDEKNQLDLIPSLLADRKPKNTYWFFLRPNKK